MGWVDDVIKALAIILPVVIIVLVAKLLMWLFSNDVPDEPHLTEDEDVRYRRMRAEDNEHRHEDWNDRFEELTGTRIYSWEEFEERQREQGTLRYTGEKFF